MEGTDPERAEVFMRLAGAERHLAGLQAQFEERSAAAVDRHQDLKEALRDQREEGKREHRELQAAFTSLAAKVDSIASAAAIATTAAAQLATERTEQRKLSTTKFVALIGAAVTLGGSIIAAVTQIVGGA